MLNLLRMDLYRMLRSKSVYICLAILLMMVMVSLGMVSLVATPQGQEMAVERGIFTAEDLAQTEDILQGVVTRLMLRPVNNTQHRAPETLRKIDTRIVH